MAVQVSYPGVYIEEFAPGAPIQGVGTSTAAFIGIAERGPLDRAARRSRRGTASRPRSARSRSPGAISGTRCAASSRTAARSATSCAPATAAYQRDDAERSHARRQRPARRRAARAPAGRTWASRVDGHRRAALERRGRSYRPHGHAAAAAQTAPMEVTLVAAGTDHGRPGRQPLQARRRSVVLGRHRPARRSRSVSGATVRFDAAADQPRSPPAPPCASPTRSAGTRTRPAATRRAARRCRPASSCPARSCTVTQGADADTQIVESVIAEVLDRRRAGQAGPVSYRVTFRSGLGIPARPGSGAVRPRPRPRTRSTSPSRSARSPCVYDRLSMDPAHPRYLIDVRQPRPERTAHRQPDRAAAAQHASADAIPSRGRGASQSGPTARAENLVDTCGTPTSPPAIDTLRAIDDVNFIAVPDRPTPAGRVDARPCSRR